MINFQSPQQRMITVRLGLSALTLLVNLANPGLAQAQTQAPKKAVTKETKAAVKPVVVDNRPVLEIALSKAQDDLERVSALIKLEKEKSEGYDPCVYRTLQATQAYDEWFIKNYSSFQSLSQTIDSVIQTANVKISTLNLTDQTIRVNAVKGQESSEVEVTLKDMIRYFKILNGRLKTIDKEQQALLLEDMEDPSKNSLGLANSQIIAAMQQMSTNLSASMREQETHYEIKFSPSNSGYSLELRVKLNLAGVAQNYTFSLLAGKTAKIELGDGAKWSALTKNQFKIDGYPVDGLKRFRMFSDKYMDKCKAQAIPSSRSGVPFLNQVEVTALVAELEKSGKVEPLLDTDFATVEAGRFQMGSLESDAGRMANQTAHLVTLTKTFEIQTNLVTQKQFYDITGTNPSSFKSKANCPNSFTTVGGGMCPENPVENVTHAEIQAFMAKLNARADGYVYRLPTEAEWELAARGGAEYISTQGSAPAMYFFGNNVSSLAQYAWYNANSDGHTHEVGLKKPNPLGLYDIYGNVWQWTQDGFSNFTSAAATDPVVPVSRWTDYKSYLVLKGGSFSNDAQMERSAWRASGVVEERYTWAGFRLVRLQNK